MASLVPGIRRVALQASSRLSGCSQCLRQPVARQVLAATWTSPTINMVRYSSSATTTATTSPLGKLARDISSRPEHEQQKTGSAAGEGESTKKSSFPDTNPKGVAYWLLGSAASVFGIVVFGGLTRLTESGLSITEWKPVTGSRPPMTAEDWESEFAKYRASPEFKLLNPYMTLDEFKKIYFMEWTHRLWGRVIGLSFALPSLYLVARRRVTPLMGANLLGISALIGFQGFIGWWMVKSGLKDDLFAEGSHPRVSQYRLTAHLGTAFVCYSWMLLSGLSILRTHRMLRAADPRAVLDGVRALRDPSLRTFRRLSIGLVGLVFTTAMSGGLVAGLDAGLIYNEFPYMGTGLTPPSSELWDRFYSRREDGSDLWWRNMLENPTTVQLDHRILAMTTFTSILALFFYARTGRLAAALPRDARRSTTGLVHLVCLQATLGISTLIYLVPIHLAATHQAGSIAVLTGALVLAHRLHVPAATVRLIEQRLKQIPSARR
ncbi:cytochrome c oxidase assembly protein subunit 15 [Geosmithia morbida]|uniref:Cytochrome c oxidase assembly protein subunit 15 n=1 Tax=Geosmithia morbida TaxID=1094350 RepID=A0A9P5D410_9HYPO|nr:cytochrome c oxidase assembly protein subunit 15 [Geosmithia morbida]KAF4125552.1 cytochrome c oxidase assembly protein subunit 15 [Geosmithia morbida]